MCFFKLKCANHVIQFFSCNQSLILVSPRFIHKSVHFDSGVNLLKLSNTLACNDAESAHELNDTIILCVLSFKVQVHHLCNVIQSMFEQLHQLLLHFDVKLAVVALDEECIQLQLHALVWLVSIIFKHVLEQVL